ncbi:MAG: hypothetical protein J6Z38_02645, partial [Lachnospiraceae bacterium]|nr:hypothetical protein [Lachnospiraceae bacterium]
MAGKTLIKTKRLVLEALDDAALAKLILTERNEAGRKLLTGKLSEVQEHPDEAPWFTVWKATEKKTGETAALLYFHGPQQRGTVEVTGIPKAADADGGYLEEALEGAADWAFSRQDVYKVVLHDTPYRETSGKDRFTRGEDGRLQAEKGTSLWLPVYLCLGMSIGLSLGIIGNRLAIGAAVGMLIGLLVGYLLDQSEKKHRAEVTGEAEAEAEAKEEHAGSPEPAAVCADARAAAADASGNAGPDASEFTDDAGEFSGEDGAQA